MLKKILVILLLILFVVFYHLYDTYNSKEYLIIHGESETQQLTLTLWWHGGVDIKTKISGTSELPQMYFTIFKMNDFEYQIFTHTTKYKLPEHIKKSDRIYNYIIS